MVSLGCVDQLASIVDVLDVTALLVKLRCFVVVGGGGGGSGVVVSASSCYALSCFGRNGVCARREIVFGRVVGLMRDRALFCRQKSHLRLMVVSCVAVCETRVIRSSPCEVIVVRHVLVGMVFLL